MESPNFAYAYVFYTLSLVLRKHNLTIDAIPDQKSFMITSRGCSESVNYLQAQIEFTKNIVDFTLSYDNHNGITISYADLYSSFDKLEQRLDDWIEKNILN
jgi:hypothetical protein